MAKQELGQFSSVDGAQNPDTFVQFLKTVNQLDIIQDLKNRTLDLLELRKGDHILDVGCGIGDVVLKIAERVGPTGRAVGIDQSDTMLAVARESAKDTNLPVEFKHSQAQNIDFPDNTFDGCRSDRVLMYIEDARKVLGEMIRVAKPGGRIVNFEPDWEMMALGNHNRTITRKILNFWCDGLPNGWLGRQMPGLHNELGQQNITITGLTLHIRTYKLFNDLFMMETTLDRAKNAGAVSAVEAEDWLSALKDDDQNGHFIFSNTGFLIGSRKPD
jgi:ubiquinone/menaquinone biosynthesis C-methylase UbiE